MDPPLLVRHTSFVLHRPPSPLLHHCEDLATFVRAACDRRSALFLSSMRTYTCLKICSYPFYGDPQPLLSDIGMFVLHDSDRHVGLIMLSLLYSDTTLEMI
jgi:hypothetical protein